MAAGEHPETKRLCCSAPNVGGLFPPLAPWVVRVAATGQTGSLLTLMGSSVNMHLLS